MIRLLADIGGTHARFTLAQDAQFNPPIIYENSSFRNESDLFARVRREVVKNTPIDTAALAVAGPVSDNAVQLTNLNWKIQAESAAKSLGVQHVDLMNDLAALALGIPHVPSELLLTLAPGEQHEGPAAVIGVGTGIGTAVLPDFGHSRLVFPAEGGHVSLPLLDETNSKLMRDAAGKFELEAETLLAASGLLRLFNAMTRNLSGQQAVNSPEQVTALVQQADPIASATFEIYTRLLGLFARDLALSVGATGGVYLAGTVLRELAAQLPESKLMENLNSGRQQAYLRRIPVTLIMDEFVAFRGLIS